MARQDQGVGRQLLVYLRDHEAAARAGVDLFDRASAHQRHRPWGPELGAVRDEVRADLGSLHRLLAEVRVRPDRWLGLTARTAERWSRLKPNGRLLVRTALTDLVEVEGATDAVHAKGNGWRALRSAGLGPASVDLDELVARAERQHERLLAVHAEAARVVGSS